MKITVLSTGGYRNDYIPVILNNNTPDIDLEIKTPDDYKFRPHLNSKAKLDAIIDESRDHIYFLNADLIYGFESMVGMIEHRCDKERNISVFTFQQILVNPVQKLLLDGNLDELVDRYSMKKIDFYTNVAKSFVNRRYEEFSAQKNKTSIKNWENLSEAEKYAQIEKLRPNIKMAISLCGERLLDSSVSAQEIADSLHRHSYEMMQQENPLKFRESYDEVKAKPESDLGREFIFADYSIYNELGLAIHDAAVLNKQKMVQAAKEEELEIEPKPTIRFVTDWEKEKYIIKVAKIWTNTYHSLSIKRQDINPITEWEKATAEEKSKRIEYVRKYVEIAFSEYGSFIIDYLVSERDIADTLHRFSYEKLQKENPKGFQESYDAVKAKPVSDLGREYVFADYGKYEILGKAMCEAGLQLQKERSIKISRDSFLDKALERCSFIDHINALPRNVNGNLYLGVSMVEILSNELHLAKGIQFFLTEEQAQQLGLTVNRDAGIRIHTGLGSGMVKESVIYQLDSTNLKEIAPKEYETLRSYFTKLDMSRAIGKDYSDIIHKIIDASLNEQRYTGKDVDFKWPDTQDLNNLSLEGAQSVSEKLERLSAIYLLLQKECLLEINHPVSEVVNNAEKGLDEGQDKGMEEQVVTQEKLENDTDIEM